VFITFPRVEQYVITLVVKRLREQNLRSMNRPNPQDSSREQVKEQLRELTSAELNTLRLVAEENNTRRIAELLFVTPKSVENYRCRICSKLGLDGSANSLLRFAINHKQIIMTA
jgi:DNA-binding NarL/FixJ family response regulator